MKNNPDKLFNHGSILDPEDHLLQLFESNFTHYFIKQYIFTTQKNNGYIILMV
jgi:hypothetical protein